MTLLDRVFPLAECDVSFGEAWLTDRIVTTFGGAQTHRVDTDYERRARAVLVMDLEGEVA